MKKAILFKSLVDILYVLHFIGLIGVLFVIPSGIININQVNLNVEDWGLLHWIIVTVSLLAYIIFLRGLYYLRKMARFLLANNYFSEDTIQNLRKSGSNFLYTGITSFAILIMLWVSKLSKGKLELIYDNNILIPLFLCITGLFFIIQSNALNLAKGIQEENELTV